MEVFGCTTRVVSGRGVLDVLGTLGAKRCFVVSDPYFEKNGWAEKIAALTRAEKWEIFADVMPDPTVTLAAQGAGRMKAFGPDLVVALGGGSAMDCAKAVNYFSGCGCPLVAIPTSSGSGSEVTDFAILTHEGVKHPLVDEKLVPGMAILEEELLQSLPRSLIADSGFDVICHALEAGAATGAGTVSGCLAREALALALENLYKSWNGELRARLPMHQAATMAGMAFSQAGLGLCHALAHALGGAFHVPHGRLNAILLPAVLRCNASAAQAAYARMARAAGIQAASDTMALRQLMNTLIRLRRELQLPETLTQAGVEPGALREKENALVAAAMEDPCCKTNPLRVDENMVRMVLREVAGNG